MNQEEQEGKAKEVNIIARKGAKNKEVTKKQTKKTGKAKQARK